MSLCKCGCGGEAEPGNEYINGHNARVNNPMKNPNAIQKQRETQRINKEIREGKRPPPVLPYCECGCGQRVTKPGNRFIQGHHMRVNNPKKGKTKETDEGIRMAGEKSSKTRKRMFVNGELEIWNKGETKETNEILRKIGEKSSKTKKAFFVSEEGQKWLDKNRRGENAPMYGKHTPLTEEHLKKILKAVCAAPNKKEQYLYWILQEIFPNEYKFVGDGSVIIGGFSPDFININGQKKLIEHFGDYWHKGDDEGNRIFQFKLFGFDTLVIWEHELNDNEIEMTIAKIIEFHYRK